MNHTIKALLLSISLSTLSACSPVNTHFSCNATAGDRCLSIEEVNAMTETHEEHAGHWRERVRMTQKHTAQTRQKAARIASNTQTIWIAPWTDEHGVRHQDDTLYADASTPFHRG